MRIGTTSYIYPADVITNIRKLAGKVRDIEIVLFESDSIGDALTNDEISELRQIALDHEMTYTVHLPLDCYLADTNPKMKSAFHAISLAQSLEPHGYVVHLDARDGNNATAFLLDNALRSLETLIRQTGLTELICVENLENHRPELIDAVLERIPVSCCADVGHIWKLGEDPVPLLKTWLQRIRIVHLHGFLEHDHRRLSLMPPSVLDPVVRQLQHANFGGVLTLEIFSERNLHESLQALQDAMDRIATEDSAVEKSAENPITP
ncbi:cobamide remodeling phosphodiesterase CbiR [Desulfomonile tiedjei]|uniref:Sugar phosphate isomerase/epimerase n=1 Tax=Desulfomonile tiedjei (strain ATCC 49306 / DSM 6799 / DCB-1) TaxID=706587 RepID=I4C773_DESTA|nr:cobamide remodeling phosphodiesterase CbiR [Desulfomonile tiedjei]AFM25414.1 sugar phosphate isomerase/epimerase [Desulfomonile tiedjei DSM 6799]